VQAALFDQAQRTRTSFESTADLYTRLARSASGLGASQADLVRVTETINKAMIISGGSAASAQAALQQLGQAFQEGRLRGDEFNSVVSQAPRLAEAIATGMGIATNDLRAMAEAGKLSAKAVFDALKTQADAVDSQFAQMPRTIGGAMQQIRNEILNTVGSMNDMSGASGGIVTALDGIRGAIGPMARAANAFFGGFAIAAADAAIAVAKIEQGVLKLQGGMAVALRAAGAQKLGDWLFGGAATGLKDGADVIRMLESQRDAIIKRVHAIAQTGAVSTTAVAGVKRLTEATDEQKKAMDAVQAATDRYHSSLQAKNADAWNGIQAAKADNAATREMIAAIRDGEAAVERVRIAQAGEQAVREKGVGISERMAAGIRREAEERERLAITLGHVQNAQADADRDRERAAEEAAREVERRAKDIRRATVSNIEGILTDISTGRNPLIALAEGFKRAMIRAMSEALAEKFLTSKFAAMLGLGVEGAAKKQDGAAIKMQTAARLQKEAADVMLRASGMDPDAKGRTGTTTANAPPPQWTSAIKSGVAAAVAGYATGQALSSTSHGTAGNLVRGALGGVASGAATGAAVGGLPGAIVGGVVGFVSGLFGASKAMKEAAKAAAEMRAAFAISMAGLRAEVGKDALAGNIAQVEAQRETLRKQIEAAWSGGSANSDTVRERNRQLAELNQLEDERIRQLREEAAVMQTRRTEDYQARLDAATPGNERAEAIAANARTLDREIEDLKRSFGNEIDAQEAATLAIALQATAAEKAKFALDQNTKAIGALTSVINAPTGFKLEPYIQEFAKGRPYPGQFSVPTNPFVPPMSPMAPTSLSQTGTVATAPVSITIAPGAIVVNESKTPQLTAQAITRAFLSEVDKERNAGSGGLSGSRAAALEQMKLPAGGIPWRS
jgi:tape measure domain-containing protein